MKVTVNECYLKLYGHMTHMQKAQNSPVRFIEELYVEGIRKRETLVNIFNEVVRKTVMDCVVI